MGWEAERAMRLVEDVIRAHPQGVPTRLLLERMTRAGVALQEACELLRALERSRRIATDGERWQLAA